MKRKDRRKRGRIVRKKKRSSLGSSGAQKRQFWNQGMQAASKANAFEPRNASSEGQSALCGTARGCGRVVIGVSMYGTGAHGVELAAMPALCSSFSVRTTHAASAVSVLSHHCIADPPWSCVRSATPAAAR